MSAFMDGPRFVRNRAFFEGFTGVTIPDDGGLPILSHVLKYADQVPMPKHLDGTLCAGKATNHRLASLLHDRIDSDDTKPAALQQGTTGLVDPKLINAMKGSDMHQYFCEGYVSNLLDTLKPAIKAKIDQDFENYKAGLNVSNALLLSIEEEHKKNCFREAEDDLAALGNHMLATSSMVYGFEPNDGHRFLFSNERHEHS